MYQSDWQIDCEPYPGPLCDPILIEWDTVYLHSTEGEVKTFTFSTNTPEEFEPGDIVWIPGGIFYGDHGQVYGKQIRSTISKTYTIFCKIIDLPKWWPLTDDQMIMSEPSD